MPEKEPQVTFTDRRKISSDGEIRPEALAEEEASRREAQRQETAKAAPKPATPSGVRESNAAQQSSAAGNKISPDAKASEHVATDTGVPDQAIPQGPTAQETAESNAAYRQTTQQLDELLRSKAPDSPHLGPVAFEHLVQSMYMTAMMGLGAGTKPGDKPRVDLMGARQTIDLLAVLQEKTKGNLTADEQQLLESALFELRMTFLEITNAIARNAAAPGQPQPPGKK